jgi:uncharacterized RDD family membrane protein YckC
MGDPGGAMSHALVRIDVSTLSRSQHDLLWMRLRADDVPFSFDGNDVAVPLGRADEAHAAVEWITQELEPLEDRYTTPRPFQRTLEDGSVVASRWGRVLAWLLDGVIIAMPYLAARWLGMSGWIAWAASAVYIVAMTHLFGRTLGKWALDLEVVAAASGERPSWGQSSMRWLVAASPWLATVFMGSVPVLAVVPAAAWIGIYLPILWDPAGQGLHDRAARTYVRRTASSLAASK